MENAFLKDFLPKNLNNGLEKLVISDASLNELNQAFSMFPQTNSFEFLVVTDGSLLATVNRKEIKLSEGQGILLFPNSFRFLSTRNKKSPRLLYVSLPKSYLSLASSVSSEGSFGDLDAFSYMTFDEGITYQREIIKLLNQISMAKQMQRPCWNVDVIGNVYKVMSLVLPHLDKATTLEPDRRIEKLSIALSYLETHYFEQLTLESVSSYLGRTPRSLTRLFVDLLGNVPSYVLLSIRLREGHKLLLKGVSIQETAKAVGMPSTSYFITKFKEMFGTTPKQFQKENASVIN